MKFCKYCGNELKEEADICLKCGKFIEKEPTYSSPTQVIPKTPKKGLGLAIASLSLGIIAAIWAFIILVGIEMAVETLVVELYYQTYQLPYIVGYYIGYTLFSFIPGLLALIFGIISARKQKRGMAITGIILGSFALLSSIFVLVVLSLSLI